MKRFGWQILLGLFLIVLSIFLYLMHYAIFRDVHHIFIYMLGSLAFLPIEVLLVILIINRLLSEREKRTRMEKLHVVIGAFFVEMGMELLTYFSKYDPKLDKIRKELIVGNDWSAQEFFRVSKRLKNYDDYGVEIRKVDLEGFRRFLVEKRNFLLRLLENPTLLEHESFTELLSATCHLTQEVSLRQGVKKLPDTDYEHLAGDIKRVYILLVQEWLDYMKHLKDNYPYLFSLAVRTNPFDQDASPLIK